ncbi:MAG: YifB family Mg chelatase-like AAA ATPase [Phototrophicaceae bacterium]|jgi:magnesium chelatase family protein
MLSIVRACTLIGLDGHIIEVQTDYNPNAQLPNFAIVGLPDSAVKESRERVRSAIKNSRLAFPNKHYVVNLYPANLPKQGAAYDLSIAVGVLAATDQIPLPALEGALFIGELSLDGTVRHVQGVMPMAFAAAQHGYRAIYVPADDAAEAALVPNIEVYPVHSLGQLVEHLYHLNPIPTFIAPPISTATLDSLPHGVTDFSAIKGQEHIKRALEIAAAGNHNVLMSGSPGVGKSLLAGAMRGILPPLMLEEALEVTRIYSVADMLPSHPLIQERPFRSPHHTVSQAGLVGGGSNPKPGEISLAHRGLLFLDEIVEYSQKTLEVMRQPIELHSVTISRASGSLTFPANFLLVAAMNPCPCGYYGDPVHPCSCSPTMIARYQGKLSGPILDRIDIHLDVPRVDYDKLMGNSIGESSLAIRARVMGARQRQTARFAGRAGLFTNTDIPVGEVRELCPLTAEAQKLLELTVKRMQLSARAYHRVLKLARTIADLEGAATLQTPHIAEAIQYRPKTLHAS